MGNGPVAGDVGRVVISPAVVHRVGPAGQTWMVLGRVLEVPNVAGDADGRRVTDLEVLGCYRLEVALDDADDDPLDALGFSEFLPR